MRAAIPVGIGLFIAFIGLQNAGIVQANPDTFVALGDLSQTGTLLALFGVVLAAILMSRAIKGALIISILTTTVVGMVVGAIPVPQGLGDLISFDLPSIAPTFGSWI